MEKTIVKHFGKCPKLPWMIEFHSNEDNTILNNQMKAAYAATHLDHLTNLNPNSKVNRERLTKVACLLPPEVNQYLISQMLGLGVSIMVIKMQNVTPATLPAVVKMIQTESAVFSKNIGRIYPVAIALEISEPQLLIGTLRDPVKEVQLNKGDTTRLTSNSSFEKRVSKDYIHVSCNDITDMIKPGDNVMVGDENINLEALEISRDMVECVVERAGKLIDNLPVRLNAPYSLPAATSQEEFLRTAAVLGIDLALVGITSIKLAREILGPTYLVFVKIESAHHMDLIDVAIDDADGVMVDGEKLAAALKENVFIMQKAIVAKCNRIGKPVIVTVSSPEVTKAQIFDVANAVLDGIDCLLVPAEVSVVEYVGNVCKSAEAAIYQKQMFSDLSDEMKPPIEPIYSVSIAAVEASLKCNACAIVVLTVTGRSARLLSRFKPRCPIIAITKFSMVSKQLMVHRGIIPLYYANPLTKAWMHEIEKRVQLGITFGKYIGLIRAGDAVVIVTGNRKGAGFTNSMQVVYASEYDTVAETSEEIDKMGERKKTLSK